MIAEHRTIAVLEPDDRVTGRHANPSTFIDLERAEMAVRSLLIALGEDPEREGLADTPRRVAKMYRELFAGVSADPAVHLKRVFHEQYDEVVLLKDIDFHSLCEHHLLPFHGKAHVAYLPNGKVVGLSKLARTVDAFARRPQVQERMTCQIADALMEHLDPKGVVVVVEAEHLCMKMRGVQKPNGTMVTSAVRGTFKESAAARAEVMSLINNCRR
ncbi:MAG TPA: GTP cyclohydrolase I FolE [Phycisphaerae bacterium]|nr:GTP cyclohydrolase I FolE [Phycisphaerae bacterium]HRY70154.1 GTP cyclohydrolase I FolE [Phycisphaerae bacterium]HSA29675.1 GTP cyclohydrolase I FolE [Phycisphaerae bacterium]